MKLGFDWQFREARLGEASACDAELGSTHKKWPEHNAGTGLILFYLSIGDPEGGWASESLSALVVILSAVVIGD